MKELNEQQKDAIVLLETWLESAKAGNIDGAVVTVSNGGQVMYGLSSGAATPQMLGVMDVARLRMAMIMMGDDDDLEDS